MMRNMQNQINSLKGEFKNEIQNTMKTQQIVLMEQHNDFQNNLQNMLSGFFQNQSSTSAITTRSGVAYEGPLIPTPKKVVERETEETTDKEQTNFQGSTAQIQPPVTPILESDVSKTLPKPSLPYPSRLNDQKLLEKATNQMEKFFQIFQDLHFDISFADALILMPKFASTIKSLLKNKDKLFMLSKIPLNENCSAMLLKKLSKNLEILANFLFHVISREWIYATPWWKSHLTFEPILSNFSPSLTSFEGSDFILEEIYAYLKDESISSEIDQADCNPEGDICLIETLLNNDPFQLPLMDLKQGEVVKAKSSIEEPSELESKDLPSHLEYAYLEGVDKLPVILSKDLKVNEKEALLKVLKSHKMSIHPTRKRPLSPIPIEHLLIVECPLAFCNAPGTFQRCMMAIFHDMIEKTMEVFMDDFLVFGDSFSSCLSHLDTMLQRCEDTNLVLNWEKCHFMVKEGIVLGNKISKNGLEVNHSKVDVIAKLPYPTTVKGVRSFLGHAGFYRRFIQDFSKISIPMTHLLKKETAFVFSKDCIDAFETLKKKLTKLRS
uniref:Reverse transcriptase domain-containing protein n=1 Tax=Tanacetum cinerariifolium TaxID=118510 RepID=A0A6L2K6V3_TANCI|nr:reverse transcriptase domain-containing protein [Tanacetum cinerariifolium]